MIRKAESEIAKVATPLVALLIFLTSWELVTRLVQVSPLVLPSPSAVLHTLADQISYLLFHGGVTLVEAVLGFVLGGVIALCLAATFQFSATMERALYPYAIAVKAIPLVALAPIVVTWFGSGPLSKVVLAAIISFFPILVTAVQGFNSVEPEAIDLMNTFSASRSEIFAKVRFPAALPSLFAGMKVSATFAVVGAVVAEFVGSNTGIGYVVKSSSYYLDTDLTFSAIIVAGAIGVLFFSAIALLERRIVFWRVAKDLRVAELPFVTSRS